MVNSSRLAHVLVFKTLRCSSEKNDSMGLLKVWLTPGLLHRCGARKDVDMPKIYNEQFKADAVALVESGMSRRQVCADLGV